MHMRAGRAVVQARSMLPCALSLGSGRSQRRGKACNQCDCDCDLQFHNPSIAAYRTRKSYAWIQDFVVWVCGFSLRIVPRKPINPHLLPSPVADAHPAVYLLSQDVFCLQPFFVYVPLLALLLEPHSGHGGVASSERLPSLQLIRHPHEPRP